MADGWTNDRTSGQPASEQPAATATGSFPNWHRLTQKKTSDDKKVDGLAREIDAKVKSEGSSSSKNGRYDCDL